jgi:hypothetical protein
MEGNTETNLTMSGADAILRVLEEQGVEVIFGYPGGAILPIYDSLFKSNSIKHILVRHEQAAVHAAEGYARSTGKVGVVLVTSGPGATNAVTGLTDALMDSVPIVCLSGQVPTHLIGNDAFQEADTTGHADFLHADERRCGIKKSVSNAPHKRAPPLVEPWYSMYVCTICGFEENRMYCIRQSFDCCVPSSR